MSPLIFEFRHIRSGPKGEWGDDGMMLRGRARGMAHKLNFSALIKEIKRRNLDLVLPQFGAVIHVVYGGVPSLFLKDAIRYLKI